MEDMLVVFSHGKESGPRGSKIRALASVAERSGAQVLSVDYREHPIGTMHDQNAEGEADRRVGQFLSTPLPSHRQLVLVGSSMGGYVSTVASMRLSVNGLFLLAPAFYLQGYANQDLVPGAERTMIIHGWRDSVVPAQNSIRFAAQHQSDLHLLDGDHRLNDALSRIEPLFELFLLQVLADMPARAWTAPSTPSGVLAGADLTRSIFGRRQRTFPVSSSNPPSHRYLSRAAARASRSRA